MSDGVATATERRVPIVGPQLFASAPHEPRSRRPTDVALAVVATVLLVITGAVSTLAEDLEQGLADLLDALPGLFEALWIVCFWAPVVWAGLLAGAAVLRRRPLLAFELVLAVVVGVLIAAVTAAVMGDGGRSVAERLTDVDGPPAFPPGAVVVAAAAIATVSPHLTRPFRHVGRWGLGLQMVAATVLGGAGPSAVVGAVAIGVLAASLVHLAFGSPGGRPTADRIRLALAGLGIEVDALSPASMQSAGVVLFDAGDDAGPMTVKVYGRDAWDAQLLANLWRLAWYRGLERTARLSRLELVEHEAFVTLLAERAGVAVPSLITAGSAGRGDALVVLRPRGVAVAADLEAPVEVASLWAELARLHEAGIIHHQVDIDRVLRSPAGSLSFGDLSTASLVGDRADRNTDRAQALVLSMLLVGEESALEAATIALGTDEVAALLPYVQTAAMPPRVRRELSGREIDLDDVRKAFASRLAVDEPAVIRLRRVTTGSMVNLALLTIAAYTLISLVSGLDLEALVDALADASWAWLAFALLLAQLPRIPAAVSTMGAVTQPLPFVPLTALQFAISYVNLAIPSTAARVAINVRFFERLGIPPVTAVTAGAIDSVSGFIVQIGIFGLLFALSDIDLDLSVDTDDLSGLATFALVALVAVLVAAVVVALMPTTRKRVRRWWAEAKSTLTVLRSPRKLLMLFGGNLLSQVLFAVALAATVRGFGYVVPLSALLLINTVVSLFAGLLPVPGGIGVSEAGITLGLTRVGIPSEIAFASALAYRLASFYIPPVWGWFCYRWLVRQRFL